jgi:hypothetical protein
VGAQKRVGGYSGEVFNSVFLSRKTESVQVLGPVFMANNRVGSAFPLAMSLLKGRVLNISQLFLSWQINIVGNISQLSYPGKKEFVNPPVSVFPGQKAELGGTSPNSIRTDIRWSGEHICTQSFLVEMQS